MPEFILGVDFGQKRIGLALGQTMTQSARALSTVANNQQLWHELAAVIKEWQISQIVIGLPLDMDGEEQEITRQVKNFAKKLQQQFELPINYIDERLTSYEAERQFKTQRANKLAKAKHKSQIDAMAAQIILQSWLDQLETA